MKKLMLLLLCINIGKLFAAQPPPDPKKDTEKRRGFVSQQVVDLAKFSQKQHLPKIVQKGLGRAAGGPTGLAVVANTYHDKKERKKLLEQVASMNVPRVSETKEEIARSFVQEKKDNLRVALVQLETFTKVKTDTNLSPRSSRRFKEEIVALKDFFLSSIYEGIKLYVESIKAVHPDEPGQSLYAQAKKEFIAYAQEYEKKWDDEFSLEDILYKYTGYIEETDKKPGELPTIPSENDTPSNVQLSDLQKTIDKLDKK